MSVKILDYKIVLSFKNMCIIPTQKVWEGVGYKSPMFTNSPILELLVSVFESHTGRSP